MPSQSVRSIHMLHTANDAMRRVKNRQPSELSLPFPALQHRLDFHGFLHELVTGGVKTSCAAKAFLRLAQKVFSVGAVEIVMVPEGIERRVSQ